MTKLCWNLILDIQTQECNVLLRDLMLNLLGVISALREFQRVGKGKNYITLGAYHTEEEKELFSMWTLLGTSNLHVDNWREVFRVTGSTGDYYITTAKSLHLIKE